MLHIVFYLSIYLASWRDNDGFVHKRIKYGTILPETSSFRTGEVNFNSSFGSTDHWFVHDILKTCILQYPRDINNHWEPSNGRIQEMLHTSGHPSIWLKCPRGASNVSVCSIFRPVLCLHYVRYAGTSQYQYDVLRLWKTSLEDGWMDGETSFASWVRKPWGLWTWSVHQLLGSAIRYHQKHSLCCFQLLCNIASTLYTHVLCIWTLWWNFAQLIFCSFWIISNQTLVPKDGLSLIDDSSLLLPRDFFQVFACFLWTHEFSLIKTLQVWIRGGVPTETQ